MQYKLLRTKFIPYPEITEVDTPYDSQVYLVIRTTSGPDLGIVITAEHALRQTLWYLAPTTPLTARAHARITAVA